VTKAPVSQQAGASHLVYFVVIWYIISRFWCVAQRKIWQPRLSYQLQKLLSGVEHVEQVTFVDIRRGRADAAPLLQKMKCLKCSQFSIRRAPEEDRVQG
jgi:hypothetical protein